MIAIEKGIIRSKSIIVETTNTLSRSNPFSAIEVLRGRSKLLLKTIYSFQTIVCYYATLHQDNFLFKLMAVHYKTVPKTNTIISSKQ
jgi:hypothetical protein